MTSDSAAVTKACPTSGYYNNCFGKKTYTDDGSYIGEWKSNRRYGFGTYISGGSDKWTGDVFVGNYVRGKRNGEGLYIWISGKALFETNYEKPPKDGWHSNSDIHKIFPSLKKQFYALSKSDRRKIQSSLKKKDFYSSSIDGQWGRGTLTGLARFSSQYLRTVNLKQSETAGQLFKGVLKQANQSTVTPASSSILTAISNRNKTLAKSYQSASATKDAYTSQSLLKRKQIQYALKKLNRYSSNIDGFYGPGTERAIINYAHANGISASSPALAFSRALNEVDVPNSFAVATKPNTNKRPSNSNTAQKEQERKERAENRRENVGNVLKFLGAVASAYADGRAQGAASASSYRPSSTTIIQAPKVNTRRNWDCVSAQCIRDEIRY